MWHNMLADGVLCGLHGKMVYDALNEQRFRWEPSKWLASYRRYAKRRGEDVVEWDGMFLGGWWPIDDRER